MFATTADELLAFFRAEVKDQAEPYLWESWEGYGYMTEAFDKVLKEANVKYQTLSLPITAGNKIVALPAKVLHIRMASLDGTLLSPVSANDIAGSTSDYGLVTHQLAGLYDGTGVPSAYVRDYEARNLRLIPEPVATGTLELQCTVTLAEPMEDGAALPTTDSEDLRLVLHFMKHLAYQKQDAETEDLTRARLHGDMFEVGVREREVSLRNYRRPPGVVKMHGW